MPKVAILGRYFAGPELVAGAEVTGKWASWCIAGSTPRKIWQDAEDTLQTVIKTTGYVNVFVYLGENIPVRHVLRVDGLVVAPETVAAPGPTFDNYANDKSHAWLRYAKMQELKQALPRDGFRELPLHDGEFATAAQKIEARAWFQMRNTGVIFVEDPLR